MSFTRTLGRRVGLGVPMPRRGARLRITPRGRLVVAVGLLLGGLLFGAWLWVQDSPLVAVDHVTVTGESGADAGAIRAALSAAARNMTTLDVQLSRLRNAVAPFPEVKNLRVRTAFPHRMIIQVIEERPVGVVDVAGREIPVAADGTLLQAVAVSSQLPVIPLTVPPVGRRLAEGRGADAVAVLAAAPYQLLPKISQVTIVAGHGPVAQVRNGPSIYFGDLTRLAAKWVAATEVLADPSSAGASYIDVTDPGRPAAGAGGTGGGTSASGTGSGASASGSTGAAQTGTATPAQVGPSTTSSGVAGTSPTTSNTSSTGG